MSTSGLLEADKIAFDLTRGRRRTAFALLLLMVGDAALNSVGIGMVLPVLQAVLQQDKINPFLLEIAPFLGTMSKDARLMVLAGGTTALFALRAGTSYAYVYANRNFAEGLRVYWINGVGRNYLLGFYKNLIGKKQGELLNNWQMETLSASRFTMNYLRFLSAFLQLAALLALALMVDWRVTLGTFLAGALVLFLIRGLAFGSAANLGAKKLRLNQAMTGQMSENIANFRELKVLGVERQRLAALQSIIAELKATFVKLTVQAELPRIISEFLAVAALMGLIVVAIVVLDEPPSVVLPMVAFFLLVFFRVTVSISQVVRSRMQALNEFPAVALVQTLANRDAQREDVVSGGDITELPGDIRFEAVRYGHKPDVPVLMDVDLVFPRGELTFLVGPSGSGKSTLLDLLMRLDAPEAGRILVGDQDARSFNLRSWRKLFGYVSQDAVLFNGTIRSNLEMANPHARDEELMDVCSLAGVKAFLGALPNGLDTAVGDRGVTLSGGQRKRIAITRALLSKPQVLILDEATTSFEERLERDMIEQLKAARPGLTIIQITHRLQTASEAKHIIVLEAGRVAAVGSWSQIAETRRVLFGT